MKELLNKNNIVRLLLTSFIFLLLSIGLYYIANFIDNIIYKNILNNFASVLVVSGIYNVIYEYVLKRSQLETIISKVNLKNSIDKSGLTDLKMKFNTVDFNKYISEVKHEIDIIHAYGDTWTRNNIGAIKEMCLKKELTIRVFILSPDSSFCTSLATHYKRDPKDMIDNILRAIERWKGLIKSISSTKSKITIYTFNGNPVHSLYRFDESLICVSQKITNEFTTYLPTIICKKNEDDEFNLYNIYFNEIENLKKSADVVIDVEEE